MNYHNIIHDDMLNGDGIRVVLFVSGCSLNCKNCHNPQTWDKNSGIIFDQEAKNEIFEELKKDHILGLTLTGGHPLEEYNLNEVTKLCKEVKQNFPHKTIWLYTGYLYENIKHLEILNYVDILVDGPYIESLKNKNLQWRGSSNQRVIDVKQTKINNKIILHCK